MGSLRLYRDIPAESLVPSYTLHNSPMCGHVTISLPQHAHAQKKGWQGEALVHCDFFWINIVSFKWYNMVLVATCMLENKAVCRT